MNLETCRVWAGALRLMGRHGRGQGSLEYIMMLSAVSIIIVIALAMMSQLKGAAMGSFMGGAGNSMTAQLANELANISVVPK